MQRLASLSTQLRRPPQPPPAPQPRQATSGAAGALHPVSILAAPTPSAGPFARVEHLRGHVHPSICVAPGGVLVVVYAEEFDDTQGKDVLVCVRSMDGGASWSAPAEVAASRVRPDTIRDTGVFEVYPGTLSTLPDGRLLATWQYAPLGDKARYKENGALCYCTSDTGGETWGEQCVIFDPADPPDPSLDDAQRHLGALRHGVLPWPDGRWLLPLRNMPAADVRLYDPRTGAMEAFGPLTKGGAGALPELEQAIKQVVRTADGSLLAMAAGGPHRGTPPFDTEPQPALLLYSGGEGCGWSLVPGFPAGECPPGVAPNMWDDDGDREGRHLLALADGRVLATWGVAGDRSAPSKGIYYNVSADGKAWDPLRTVTVLPELMVVGRYFSPRTIELGGGDVGTVFVQGDQAAMEGVGFLRVPLAALA
jgi:hypothetical protein